MTQATKPSKYENHPLADIFPMMEEKDLKALADDIKANGQRESGLLYEGKILDGRNRYAACLLADVEMEFAEHDPPDESIFGTGLGPMTAASAALGVIGFMKAALGFRAGAFVAVAIGSPLENGTITRRTRGRCA